MLRDSTPSSLPGSPTRPATMDVDVVSLAPGLGEGGPVDVARDLDAYVCGEYVFDVEVACAALREDPFDVAARGELVRLIVQEAPFVDGAKRRLVAAGRWTDVAGS